MKMTLFVSLGLLLGVSPALADETEPFTWSRATIQLVQSGDVDRGQAVAEKVRCQKCHGEVGISEDDEIPSIAGQVPAYFFKQLVDFQTETRDSSDMKKATRRLSRQDMADLAAYYGVQTPEPPAGGVATPRLVIGGDESRLLLGCSVCHGKQGEGRGFEVPALMGQKIDHLVETMTAFRTGERSNDHFARMRFIAGQLRPEEIAEVAEYYAAARMPEEE